MGGVAGAISEAKYNNTILYNVIGGGRPSGICGSGLIDLIAILIENNVIDETGAFDYINCNSKLKQKMIGDKFYITEDIFISQKDIREFQLGKSAICSGIVTITTLAGLSLNDIDTIIIAGGLGFYINHDSAVTTGLIPKELKDKIRVVGNSAGYGAKLCTMSEKHLKECDQIAKNCTNIELSTESLFMSEYIENMSF